MESSYNSTKQFLINTPLPEQTRTYKPVSHKQLMDLTLEGIHQAGFSLDKEIYSSAKDGLIANGKYLIKDVLDSEMQMQLIWQNSYNKALSLSFSIGAMVLVCTNGMISMRNLNSFRKKHVGEIQTFAPERITEYIKRAGDIFAGLQGDREAMKQVEISKRVQAELIGRMYIEESFLESTQLNIIKRELIKPTFDYNASHSLWELYNFTTFAIGGIHPARWIEDHIDAHRFFVNASGLLINTEDNKPAIFKDPSPFTQLSWLDEVAVEA
jgi:hypothetical protein